MLMVQPQPLCKRWPQRDYRGYRGLYRRLFRDTGKENGNYYIVVYWGYNGVPNPAKRGDVPRAGVMNGTLQAPKPKSAKGGGDVPGPEALHGYIGVI